MSSQPNLALYGGEPVRQRPLPPMHPGASFIEEEELRAVEEVLRSQSLYRYYGPRFLDRTKAFEDAFAQFVGVRYALAVNSGTSALHCALVGCGVGPGDEVIIPSYAWISCPSAVVACGARPVLANIDESLTLDPADVENCVTDRTKAIMAVHIRGVSCDLDALQKIAKRYELKLIEDCAQAAGGRYGGKRLGGIGDVGSYSFQLNKMISAGEGGALATNALDIYERAEMFHDAGAPYRRKYDREVIPGLNYRMNEISATIMTEQLKRIDAIIELMRKSKEKIKKGISDIGGLSFRKLPSSGEGDVAICLVFYVPTAEKAREFKNALRAENIYTPSGGYPPVLLDSDSFDGHVFVHWVHIFKNLEKVLDKYSQTVDLLSRAVHLDISPLLSEEDIDSIVAGTHKIAEDLL